MSSPGVAVIIPTHNRRQKLIRCVQSLAKQSYDNFRIVIIDDASEPPVAPSWFPSMSKIVIIRNDHNCRQASSRNRGIRSVLAELYILIDDDCFVEDSDWINKHVHLHQWQPDCLIGGKIRNLTDTVWGKARAMLTRDGIQYGNFLQTMNFSFRRSTFDELGGFNEEFGELEDVDFSQRAWRMGKRLVYDRSLVILHQFDDSLTAILRRNFQYGRWTIPVRKIQKFDGHWILPGSLLASLVYYIPLSLLSTAAQVLFGLKQHPAILMATPLILCYTLCHTAGMVRYYWDLHATDPSRFQDHRPI